MAIIQCWLPFPVCSFSPQSVWRNCFSCWLCSVHSLRAVVSKDGGRANRGSDGVWGGNIFPVCFFFQFLFDFYLKREKNAALLKFDIQIDNGILLRQLWGIYGTSGIFRGGQVVSQCTEIMVLPSFASFQATETLSVPKENYRSFYLVP